MCEVCQDVHNLDIHEETDGKTYIIYSLVCARCHIEVKHKDDIAGNLCHRNRKYLSQLSQDISDEIEEYGGLDNWKKAFHIKEKDEQPDFPKVCTRISLE